MIKNKNLDNFHARLKKIRQTLGFTQEAFSKILSISKPTLVRYEGGGREPDAGLLSVLINKYRVNINWLLTGEGEMFLPKKDNRSLYILNHLDKEVVEMLELLNIPEIKRSILAEFDQLKQIFNPLVDNYYAKKKARKKK